MFNRLYMKTCIDKGGKNDSKVFFFSLFVLCFRLITSRASPP